LALKRPARIVVQGGDDVPSITFRKEYTMQLPTRIRAARTALAHRRTMRLAHRRLSAELAGFRSPAERAELEHMLGRYSAEETREIRAILNRQDFERQRQVARETAGLGGYRG
jgi:hypothetical protein